MRCSNARTIFCRLEHCRDQASSGRAGDRFACAPRPQNTRCVAGGLCLVLAGRDAFCDGISGFCEGARAGCAADCGQSCLVMRQTRLISFAQGSLTQSPIHWRTYSRNLGNSSGPSTRRFACLARSRMYCVGSRAESSQLCPYRPRASLLRLSIL